MQPLDSRPHSCLAMQCRIPQVTPINVDISHFQCDKINVFKLVCLVTTLSTSWQRKTGSAAERAKPPPPPPPPVWPLHWPPGGGGVRPCLRGRSTIRSAAPRARARPSSRQGFDQTTAPAARCRRRASSLSLRKGDPNLPGTVGIGFYDFHHVTLFCQSKI